MDTAGRRSPSPSSGRSSPVPRASKRAVEEGLYKADKSLRRYAATVERALSSWEISPQEWADYIAFLGRLLKAIQSHPKDAPFLPHSRLVASRLAQCLNPVLPSGVHQKSLEVYEYIFSTFGQDYTAGHLHEFFPGLSSVLTFASLSVRPALYTIYEDYLVRLPASGIRPVLKALILSLLPALEEETSEDYDRAFRIMESLERTFSPNEIEEHTNSDKDGYFWQCLFLAVITSPSKRQGALNFLVQKLPKFTPVDRGVDDKGFPGAEESSTKLSPRLESVVSPEPGLLIRCFACGLSDSQILIQRGFLDLLVTNLPLNSPLIQSRIRSEDLDRLLSAAVQVLLRREMSLNRRLWSWFLGPDPKTNPSEGQTTLPNTQSKASVDVRSEWQFKYFSRYSQKPLERCLLAMYQRNTSNPAQMARPFRICLSLMDRWEIGGSIAPHIFLPAIQSAYNYSLSAQANDTTELLRSASLFFDGIEATLIWGRLLELLQNGFKPEKNDNDLQLFLWVVRHFNINDEEMLTVHTPYVTIYLLSLLEDSELSSTSQTKEDTVLAIVSTLLDVIPKRGFIPSTKELSQTPTFSANASTIHIRSVIDSFYKTRGQTTNNDPPLGSQSKAQVLYHLVECLIFRTLKHNLEDGFVRAVPFLLTISSKISPSVSLERGNLASAILQALDGARSGQRTLSFPTINSFVSLMVQSDSFQQNTPIVTKTDILALEPFIIAQIWRYLSPSFAKYNVEAVRAFWQVQDLVSSDGCLEASLTCLVRNGLGRNPQPGCDRAETARRFAVLWGHTLPAFSATKSNTQGFARRGSTMPNIPDTKQALHRQKTLTDPLMLTLDVLSNPADVGFNVVNTWLHSLSSLEQIFCIHFDYLDELTRVPTKPTHHESKLVNRNASETSRQLEYIVEHFLGMLRRANDWVWQCLANIPRPASKGEGVTGGVEALADCCTRLLCSDDYVATKLKNQSIELLEILVESPLAVRLTVLDLDARLMDYLISSMVVDRGNLQGPLLNLIDRALKLRLIIEPSELRSDGPRVSINTKRPSSSRIQQSPTGSATSLAIVPPPQLLDCLRMGFSAKAARPHIEQWLSFLSSVLPVFANAIFASVIPLVECLCVELDKVHNDLVSMSRRWNDVTTFAPEATTMALVEALEMVLARAHECLMDEYSAEPSPKPAPQSRGLLGNVTSNMFRSEGLPSRTAHANSRLTVVLTFQDAIRVTTKLWVWANHIGDIENFDKISAATTAYNALKVRNRTRSLMEQIFEIEPLECLEVLISNWCSTTDSKLAAATIGLLHVLQGQSPKNVVPTIMDALCSRTNPSVLPSQRLSSQTVDLTGFDIALFLSAYLQSIEDDAMDEVWSDIVAFFRDVLSNPLPYRSVLPSILSIILLLARKADNTNFGEQRKMRRDLGDVFLRLLSATFTTMPAGYSPGTEPYESQSAGANGSNSVQGRKTMSLPIVLRDVTANIEVILETSDRTTAAINSISSNLVSPLIHAKTFPHNITFETLTLLLQISKKAPSVKSWKKEVLDAFNDPRLLDTPTLQMELGWFPLLNQWCLCDKERFPELLSRLTAPSSAGIMFGVGANAARLEADRKTQFNLRRICMLLLASPQDTFSMHSRIIEERLIALFDASASSSPSAAIKAELFMLCRALALSTSTVQLASVWPIINENLQKALTSVLPNEANSNAFNNLSLLQACKLLDLLIVLSPDEFQLYEWLYITDTIDAVYQPSTWSSSALGDRVAEALASDGFDDSNGMIPTTPVAGGVSGIRRPMLDNASISDKEDLKAATREDFARAVVRPFLSQLSIHAYEGVYSMETPDIEASRRGLLEDLLDLSTIVE